MATVYLFTAAITVLFLILTYRVIFLRYRYRVGVGDNDHPDLHRSVRAHANLAENAPLMIIFLFFLAKLGFITPVLNVFAIAGVIARILHAWGLMKTPGPCWQRGAGVLLTHLFLIISAALCLWYGDIENIARMI